MGTRRTETVARFVDDDEAEAPARGNGRSGVLGSRNGQGLLAQRLRANPYRCQTPMLRSACMASFSTRLVEVEPSRRSFRSDSPCLAPLAPTRLHLVATVGLEMGIPGEGRQARESGFLYRP
jgi:hypothetical protein